MTRSALLVLTLTLLVGCTPCRQFYEKADECEDLGEGWTVSSATAVCEDEMDDLNSWAKEDVSCLLRCISRGSCTRYFDQLYLSDECVQECGLSGDDDDSGR